MIRIKGVPSGFGILMAQLAGFGAMRTSQCDLGNAGGNEHVALWIMVVGIVSGAFLAIAM